jgi:hypothetical protein
VDSPLDSLYAVAVFGVTAANHLPISVDACTNSSVDEQCADGVRIPEDEATVPRQGVASWKIGLNPAHNANGNGAIVFLVFDELNDASPLARFKFTVLAVNDAPELTVLESSQEFDNGAVGFVITASDIDTQFGEVSLTASDPAGFGSFSLAGRNISSEPTTSVPCFQPDTRSITCSVGIRSLPGWFNVVRYTRTNPADFSTVYFTLNDLNNVDYRPAHNLTANVSLFIAPLSNSSFLSDVRVSSSSSTSILIGGIIAGVIAASLLAGLLIGCRSQRAKINVEEYFDQFALDLEGHSNASKIYEPGVVGGSSAIYQTHMKTSPSTPKMKTTGSVMDLFFTPRGTAKSTTKA